MENARAQFNKNSEERRKQRTKILFVLLLLFLLVLAGAIAFLRKADLQINTVTVSGTEAIDPASIVRSMDAALEGNYFWVVPKRNTLLFSKRAARARLMAEFPGLRDAQIKFENRSSITVVVTERESDHIWCDSARGCYFVDDTGILYRESPQFSDGVYAYFSGNLIELPTEDQGLVHNRFVAASDYQKMVDLYKLLTTYGIGIHEIAVTPERDVYVRIFTIKNYRVTPTARIALKLDDGAQASQDNLELLLTDRGFVNALIAKGGELETIDLRFAGKIFYKFKNATQVDTSATTSVVTPAVQ